MKKELLISAKFDTSDFDKSVSEMQRRLKELYAPSDHMRMQSQTAQRLQSQGFGGIMSAPTQNQVNTATQKTRRDFDQLISEQSRGQEKLTKVISKRLDILKELETKQRGLLKGSQEELAVKEKIAKVEENNSRLRDMYRSRDAQINQMLDIREQTKPGGRLGNMSSGQMAGGIGSILATVGALGEKASEVFRDMSKGQVRTEVSTGSAVQGIFGKDVGNIFGRRSAFEMNFAPERARASEQSLKALEAAQLADKTGTGMGLMKSFGGGMAAGAAGGALFGGLGAIPGAVIGGIGGLGKGIWDIAGDERKRSMLFNKERYQSILAEDLSKDYSTSYEAQKQQNPFKTFAVGEYEQNFQRNLGAQRGMGIGNEQFYGQGGFLQRNIGAGFTPEMGLEMSGNILAAGGSSRSANMNSVLGNQMQRSMGMTNAGQVLGTLSGGLGGGESTRQATIKILAEGMKLGLDDSKFAEENRRFTQAAAEVISRSGARTDDDFKRISEGFGRFQAESTNKGIEAGKSAYEEYQQISSTTSGPRGVIRAAGFMRDAQLSKLSTIDKTALMQIPEEQLTEDNPLVSTMAEKIGLSPQELVKKISNINQNSVSRFGQADKLRDRLKARGIDVSRSQDRDYMSSLSKEDRQDVGQLMAFQTAELGFQSTRQMVARATGTVGGKPGAGTDQAVEGILGGKSGRMEDNTIAAMAADAGTVLKNFNEMRGGMDAAAKSAAAFTDAIREMNAKLIQALEAARGSSDPQTLKTLQQVMRDAANMASGNQVQGGKTAK